jgi:hypothetical protein
MNAHRAEDVEGSQVSGERFTVTLIPNASQDLRLLQERTSLSRTDLTNRAITLYQFVEDQLRSGNDILARNNATGESQLVKLLSAPEGQAAAAGPTRTGWGQAAPLRRWRRGRHRRLHPVPSRPRIPVAIRKPRLAVVASLTSLVFLAWRAWT